MDVEDFVKALVCILLGIWTVGLSIITLLWIGAQAGLK